jgi:two-component system response regulator HydG
MGFANLADDQLPDPIARTEPLALLSARPASSSIGSDQSVARNIQSALLATRGLVHASRTTQQMIARLASVATTGTIVLIQGNDGTGKQFVARALHDALAGPEAPFLTTAGPVDRDTLQRAAGGTLLVQHVERLQLPDQRTLLRLVANAAVARSEAFDGHVVCTCGRDVIDAVATGELDEALYELLMARRVIVPDLKERPEDIPTLARWYVDRLSGSTAPVTIEPDVLGVLSAYTWPGNTRQLFQELEASLHRTGLEPVTRIRTNDLSPTIRSAVSSQHVSREGRSLQRVMEETEKTFILEALRNRRGSVSATATDLGVSRQGLYKKLRKFSIDPGDLVAERRSVSWEADHP